MGGFCFIYSVKNGVIVRRLRRKLCRTGIYHLISSADIPLIPQSLYLILRDSGKTGNHIVRELDALGFL